MDEEPQPRSVGPRVVIVDRCEDNREVLRTVLRRVGAEIYEASRGDRGLDLIKRVHPDVVVVDSDTLDPTNQSVCAGFNEETQGDTAVVLLGTIAKETSALRSHESIRKPYQYAPLIRKIEALLRAAEEPSS